MNDFLKSRLEYLQYGELEDSNLFFFFFGLDVKSLTIISSIFGKIKSVVFNESSGFDNENNHFELLIDFHKNFDSETEVISLQKSKIRPVLDNLTYLPIKKNLNIWIQDALMVVKDDMGYNTYLISTNSENISEILSKRMDGGNQKFKPVRSFFTIPMGNLIVGDNFVLIGEEAVENQISDWKSIKFQIDDDVVSLFELVKRYVADKVDEPEIPDESRIFRFMMRKLFGMQFWIQVSNKPYIEKKDKKLIPKYNNEYFPNIEGHKDLFTQISDEKKMLLSSKLWEGAESETLVGIPYTDFEFHLDYFLNFVGYDFLGKRIFFLGKPKYIGSSYNKFEAFEEYTEKRVEGIKKELSKIFKNNCKFEEIDMPYFEHKSNIPTILSYNNCIIENTQKIKRAIIPKYQTGNLSIDNKIEEIEKQVLSKFRYYLPESVFSTNMFESLIQKRTGLHCFCKVIERT